jgi:hypothetical protein
MESSMDIMADVAAAAAAAGAAADDGGAAADGAAAAAAADDGGAAADGDGAASPPGSSGKYTLALTCDECMYDNMAPPVLPPPVVPAPVLPVSPEIDISGLNLAAALIRGDITKSQIFDECKSFKEMLKLSGIEDLVVKGEPKSGSYNAVRIGKCKFNGVEKEIVLRRPLPLQNGMENYLLRPVDDELTSKEKTRLNTELINGDFWRTCSDGEIVPQVYCCTLFKEDDMIMNCMVSEKYDLDLNDYYNQGDRRGPENDKLIAEQLYILLDKLFENHYWCVDLKPPNCVIKFEGETPIVKLIDVDSGNDEVDDFCGKKVTTLVMDSHGFRANLGILIKLILTIVFIIYLPVNIFAYLPNEDLFKDDSHGTCRAIFMSHYTGYYNDKLILGISANMITIIDAYTRTLRLIMRALGNKFLDPATVDDPVGIQQVKETLYNASYTLPNHNGRKMISPIFFNAMWEISKNAELDVMEPDKINSHLIKVAEMGINYPFGRPVSSRIIKREGLLMFDEKLREIGVATSLAEQGPSKKAKAGYSKKKRRKKRKTKKRKTKKRKTKKRKTKRRKS